MGKATAAAKRIFLIMEQPSEIDAIEMDETDKKDKLSEGLPMK